MQFLLKLKSFFSADLLGILVSGYKKIPPLYKTTFWTVFIVLNIVFAFHTINFFWGNHDWPRMKGYISPTEFWYEARFTQTIPYLLIGSRILPVLMNILCFFGLSLSVLALAIYWKVPKNTATYVSFCLAVALMPYNLVWLYLIAQMSCLWGTAIVIGALELYSRKCKSIFSVGWNAVVVMILFFALGMNASFLETLLICLIGRYFIEFIQGEKILTLLKKVGVLFLDIILAVVILKGCVALATHYHVLAKDFYNTQHISLMEIPSKFLKILPNMWEQFTYTYPFIDATFLGLLLGMGGIALISVFCVCIKKRGWCWGMIGTGAMVVGLLIASQLTPLIAKEDYVRFWLRVTGYFGLYHIFALMLAFLYCFLNRGFLKNIVFLITVAVIVLSVHRDMYAMRVWYQGKEAENKLMDRVMGRIESVPGFSYDRQYAIVLLGDFSLRKRYYDLPYKDQDSTVLGWSYRAPWETRTYFNFYAPTDFIYANYRNYWDLNFVGQLFPKLTMDTFEFIQKRAKVWPDQNSVFIKNGVIFVILDKNLLNEFKSESAKYLLRNPILREKKTMKLYHPNWPDGVEQIEFLMVDRIIHPRMNLLATVESVSDDKIIVVWDCCGREVFVKNAEGIYAFQKP